VRNDTGTTIYDVRVSVSFYAASWETRGYPKGITMILPGEQMPFYISVSLPAPDWAYYQFAIERYDTEYRGFELPTRLQVVNISDYWSHGYYFVEGGVQNDTTNRMRSVQVLLTLYDQSGSIIAFGTYYVADELKPGASAPFRVRWTGWQFLPDKAKLASYTIVATGYG